MFEGYARDLYPRLITTFNSGYLGHINNVVYNRFAESARCNWTLVFANKLDSAHKTEWTELITPKSTGLILRSIKTDYKFVSIHLVLHHNCEATILHL